MVLTAGPGKGLLVFVVTQHLTDQMQQLFTLLTQPTSFCGSELVVYFKVKTKTGRVRLLQTTGFIRD